MNSECKHDHVSSRHSSKAFRELMNWNAANCRRHFLICNFPPPMLLDDVYKDVFLLTCWENGAETSVLFLFALIFKHSRTEKHFWCEHSHQMISSDFLRMRLTEFSLRSSNEIRRPLNVVKLFLGVKEFFRVANKSLCLHNRYKSSEWNESSPPAS